MATLRPHSGVTGLLCADWGLSQRRDADGQPLFDAPCYEGVFTSWAQQLPGNVSNGDPHLTRFEAPALVLSDLDDMAAFLATNPTVLAATNVLGVAGHSHCAGVHAHAAGSDIALTDERGWQVELMWAGLQPAADVLSTFRLRATEAHAFYVALDDQHRPTVEFIGHRTGRVGRHLDVGLELPDGQVVPIDWERPRLRAVRAQVAV